ncbi:MerC domain-containing protein [Sphingosinicella sp. BN140058]|nr:MerC domain-containing protein [Sphingosinicella sp. BN140058]
MLYLLRSALIKGRHGGYGDTMFANTARSGMMDRMAIALSGLCLVHCLASAVFVAVLASAGGMLLNPVIHEVGLMMAIVLGVVALGRGIVDHGFMMPSAVGGLGLGVMGGSLMLPHGGSEIYSVIGVLIVALGHDLNRRAVI